MKAEATERPVCCPTHNMYHGVDEGCWKCLRESQAQQDTPKTDDEPPMTPEELIERLTDDDDKAVFADLEKLHHKMKARGLLIRELIYERDEARKAAAAAGAVGPWMWQDNEDNFLESLGDSQAVKITGGQLRLLVAELTTTGERVCVHSRLIRKLCPVCPPAGARMESPDV